MKFISYYTKNTPYEKVMKTQLLPSLKAFNLTYDIEAIEDLGNWANNTNYKSTFILKMLNKHKCPVIFLDADATILKFPKLFYQIPKQYDLCAHYLDWYFRWKNQKGNLRRDFLSGTLWLNYNVKIINLVKEFIKEIKKSPNQWEQKTMQQVIKKHKDLKIYPLPYSYITFPNQNGAHPAHMLKESEVIIYHSQASRKFKHRDKWRKKWIIED